MNFFRDRKMYSCLLKRKYRQRLSYGEQLLKEQYLTAVVSLKIVNLIIAWLLDIGLYTRQKVGLILKMIWKQFATMQILIQIMLLRLKKMPRTILRIVVKKGQHYYQLYWIEHLQGINNGS